MKVILTEDVEKLGASHEVVEVADGYARNFLLPRSLAVPATASAMANLENTRRVSERRIVRLRGAAEEQAAQLNGKTVRINAKIGNSGRLYGSIGTADIVSQLKSTLGVELDRKQVELGEPIRSTGLYPIELNLHRDVKAQVNIQIGDEPVGGFPVAASASASAATPAPAETEAQPEAASV
jgi:large subunit ribosomal protein L9